MTKPITKLLLAAVVFAPLVAAADDETADAAYKRGQAALKAGRTHEACDAFAASDKLTPKIETELSLADCLEQDGKVMSAARLYKSLAEKDTNAARAKKSSAKATKLEAKAPRLRFAIEAKPGLVVKVDGEVVPATEDLRVDIGPHEVTATAPGFEGHASPAVDGSRPIIDVIVRLEAKAEPAPPPTPEPTPPPVQQPPPAPTQPPPVEVMTPPPTRAVEVSSTSHRKRNGVILTAAGAGLAVGAGVMFGIAASKFSTEHDLCPNAMCANTMDLARANALLDNGTTIRSVGIGVGIGGVALLAIGGYLLLTPDHDGREAPQVSLQVGGGTTALGFGGSF